MEQNLKELSTFFLATPAVLLILLSFPPPHPTLAVAVLSTAFLQSVVTVLLDIINERCELIMLPGGPSCLSSVLSIKI